jgi:hypothetical protein
MRIKLLLAILGLVAAFAANADQNSASITINGKTFALTHARAWKNGGSRGIPNVEIHFAEKDLPGIDWNKGDDDFMHGVFGVALILKPESIWEKDRKDTKEPYHYTFGADYMNMAYAADCGNWYRKPLHVDDGKNAVFMTLQNNRVSGKVDWQGKDECELDDHHTAVTALSVQFNLPLEDAPSLGEAPKQ